MKIDISKLNRNKKYEFKVMYTDYKTQTLIESNDWIPVKTPEAFDLFTKGFSERYYPIKVREIK